MKWADREQAARATLLAEYWDGRQALFRAGSSTAARTRWSLGAGPWHPWWQAQGLQVLLDGVAAGDGAAEPCAALVVRLVAGIERRQGGLLANEYHDDLAWLGLALLRAHRLGMLGPEPAVALARRLADAVEPSGAVRWRVGDELRNVAATAPAALLILGAAAVAGEPAWGGLVARMAGWLHATLVEPTGAVWDGARLRGGRLMPEGRLWSYNVGSMVALDLALAERAPVDERTGLLQRAARVLGAGSSALAAGCAEVPAAAALLRSGGPGTGVAAGQSAGGSGAWPPAGGAGVWRDEVSDGSGADPQLFRGILAGAVADLVLAGSGPGGPAGRLPPDLGRALAGQLARQAATAWATRDARGRIGPGWVTPVRERPTLAAHLTGCLVLGSLARLEREGLLAPTGR